MEKIIITCDGFIIPNNICVLSKSYCSTSNGEIGKFYQNILDINNIKNDIEHEKFTQFWLTNNKSDNICCHGISINGRKLESTGLYKAELVPYSLFKNIKEGESFTYHYKYDEDTLIEFIITAKQEPYRYGFYTFEETVARML